MLSKHFNHLAFTYILAAIWIIATFSLVPFELETAFKYALYSGLIVGAVVLIYNVYLFTGIRRQLVANNLPTGITGFTIVSVIGAIGLICAFLHFTNIAHNDFTITFGFFFIPLFLIGSLVAGIRYALRHRFGLICLGTIISAVAPIIWIIWVLCDAHYLARHPNVEFYSFLLTIYAVCFGFILTALGWRQAAKKFSAQA